MPASIIFHALERGVPAASVARYDAAYTAVTAGGAYTTTLGAGETLDDVCDEARYYLRQRALNVGFGFSDGTLTIFQAM